MIILGLVLAGLAALIHVYIFYLESIAWTSAQARATFGTTIEEAEITRALAFNQGFYNLFLTTIIAIGIILYVVGATTIGATLVFAGVGSMVAAGVVLLLSSPSKARSALIQLVPPLIAIIALAVGVAAD